MKQNSSYEVWRFNLGQASSIGIIEQMICPSIRETDSIRIAWFFLCCLAYFVLGDLITRGLVPLVYVFSLLALYDRPSYPKTTNAVVVLLQLHSKSCVSDCSSVKPQSCFTPHLFRAFPQGTNHYLLDFFIHRPLPMLFLSLSAALGNCACPSYICLVAHVCV